MSDYTVFTATIPAFRHFIFFFTLFVLPSFPFQLQRVPAYFQKHTFFFLGFEMEQNPTVQSLKLGAPPASLQSIKSPIP